MKILFYLSSLLLSLSLVSCSTTSSEQQLPVPTCVKPGQMTKIEMGDLFTMKSSGEIFLVDCRPSLFYRMGHIDGAVSFPHKKFDSQFAIMKPMLDQAKSAGRVTVFYCQNTKCPDAYKAAKKLSAQGYDVSIYHGGWDEWKRAGLDNI